MNRRTGLILSGWDHVRQSLEVIWTTHVGDRVMLLEFGSVLRSLLAEDLTPALALQIYDELVTAAHRFEPEYRLQELQFVRLSESGMLALKHSGLYYPEGRLGNYAIAVPAFAAPQRLGRWEIAV